MGSVPDHGNKVSHTIFLVSQCILSYVYTIVWSVCLFFFFLVFLFIYVAAPGFSCSTRNLRSLLQHVKSLVSACKFLVAA